MLADWLDHGWLNAALAVEYRRYRRKLRRQCARPETTQSTTLLRILDRNANSRFGMDHGFGAVRSVADFQKRVPAQNYESLRNYIQTELETGHPALTTEPAVMYARTSGTTGQPKLLPVTSTMLDRYRQQQRLLAAIQRHVAPRAYAGNALNIVGAAIEGRTGRGIPFGSMSGFVRSTMPSFLHRREIAPEELFAIDDYETRYLLLLRVALASPGITALGSANPATFLRLHTLMQNHTERLIRAIADGTLPLGIELPEKVHAALAPRVHKNPQRARELASLAERGKFQYAQLWPNLQLLTTWTSGPSRLAFSRLQPMLPPHTRTLDLGYISSELRGTLPVESGAAHAVPLLDDHFFEFVAREAWEAQRPEFLTIDQLTDGGEYYLFVTTEALYRYAMDDIVRVHGYLARTPLLEFVQKGRGCTSLVGEKLYESQVVQALRDVVTHGGFTYVFCLLVADESANVYFLYVEPQDTVEISSADLATALDQRLGQLNIEYAAKRDSGRLAPLQVKQVRRGTGEAFVRHHVQAGQRESQFKQATLQYARELSFPIQNHIEM